MYTLKLDDWMYFFNGSMCNVKGVAWVKTPPLTPLVECKLSTFTQVLYLSTNSRYLYFTWEFPFYGTFYFQYILPIILTYIYLKEVLNSGLLLVVEYFHSTVLSEYFSHRWLPVPSLSDAQKHNSKWMLMLLCIYLIYKLAIICLNVQ